MFGQTQFGKGDYTTPSHLPEPSGFADYEAFEVEDLDNGEEGKGAEGYTRMNDVYRKVQDTQDRRHVTVVDLLGSTRLICMTGLSFCAEFHLQNMQNCSQAQVA